VLSFALIKDFNLLQISSIIDKRLFHIEKGKNLSNVSMTNIPMKKMKSLIAITFHFHFILVHISQSYLTFLHDLKKSSKSTNAEKCVVRC
jgi:hypothetical protein